MVTHHFSTNDSKEHKFIKKQIWHTKKKKKDNFSRNIFLKLSNSLPQDILHSIGVKIATFGASL